MKKLNLTILSSILLTTSLLTIKSNAQDNIYQTYTKPIPKTHNLQGLPKEVQEDIQSIQNMKYLKLKTSSDYEIAISNDDGTYSYIQSEDTIEKKIMSQMYDFEIVGKSGYGIDASIENAEENEDKLQLFSKDNNSKTLKVIVNKGNLNNAHIKIELQKRTSSFTYTDIENTIVANEINSSELKGENELKIKNTLEGGMYRIIVSLYDEYEDEYSQKVINFMVE